VEHAVADVAGVAMTEKQVSERVRLGADPPAVQPLAVVGIHL
jgi:hypothetical protein